jgi:hypothetical protein
VVDLLAEYFLQRVILVDILLLQMQSHLLILQLYLVLQYTLDYRQHLLHLHLLMLLLKKLNLFHFHL